MRGLLALIVTLGLVTPAAWGQPPRVETFSWAPSQGAVAYRVYQCQQACWNVKDVRTHWRQVAEAEGPAFILPIPDRRTFWMAATVYPDREIFRWNVVWYTVPGPSFVTVPPP